MEPSPSRNLKPWLFMLALCFSCGSLTAQVNTHWEFSDGIRVDQTVFFLTEYSLYRPGKTIIPMYMATPRKTFFDGFFLYSYDEKTGSLTNIADLRTQAGAILGNTICARFAREGNKIIISYQTDWDKATQTSGEDIIVYDFLSGGITLLSESEEKTAMKKYFSSYRSPVTANQGIVGSSEVYAKTGFLPFSAWELPSPLGYDGRKTSELVKSFIEADGDRYYRTGLLDKFISEFSADKLSSIISKMKTRINKLKSIRKTYYQAYYEEWACRLRMEAQRKNIPVSNEKGQTPLMSAAYLNSAETAGKLIASGADINAGDAEGRTALMYAIFGNADGTLKLLFKKGAKAGLTTISGWNAWMFASRTPLRALYLKLMEDTQ